MQVPCKVCGEFDCQCKYIMAKTVVSILNASSNLVPYYHRELSMAEELIWYAEREV